MKTTRLFSGIVMLAVACLALTGALCACACSPGATQDADGAESQDANAAQADDGATPDYGLLASIMGDEAAAKLIEESEYDADRRWIASHPEDIAFEGDAVQMKLLTLAANEDEAVPFVRQFAELYPSDDVLENVPTIETGSDRKVPCLYQWDQRWGYSIYSSTAFGLTGCGPTALAMAYQGVTGRHDLSPYDMSLLSQELGCMAQFEGTDTALFSLASPDLGMSCALIGVDESLLRSELAAGHVVIANMAHGYFSRFDGHFLVLTGIDNDGKLELNDPYSVVHSQQTWDIDFILSETKGLYSFSRA